MNIRKVIITSVSLWDVKSHHGLSYFTKMKISAHGHKTPPHYARGNVDRMRI
jgi:hypothetical protein